MMAQFIIPRTGDGHINVAVERDDGAQLSFAADDNGNRNALHYRRTMLLQFDGDGHATGDEQTWITPEQYLRSLADFLGYDLVKRIDSVEDIALSVHQIALLTGMIEDGGYILAIGRVRQWTGAAFSYAERYVDALKERIENGKV
jgi:hypothetical protein